MLSVGRQKEDEELEYYHWKRRMKKVKYSMLSVGRQKEETELVCYQRKGRKKTVSVGCQWEGRRRSRVGMKADVRKTVSS